MIRTNFCKVRTLTAELREQATRATTLEQLLHKERDRGTKNSKKVRILLKKLQERDERIAELQRSAPKPVAEFAMDDDVDWAQNKKCKYH